MIIFYEFKEIWISATVLKEIWHYEVVWSTWSLHREERSGNEEDVRMKGEARTEGRSGKARIRSEEAREASRRQQEMGRKKEKREINSGFLLTLFKPF